ncbi:MAG: hypothetical protein A2511_07825 [Deltaproteobacteria bacterium RIFOXYD12_FULL_50_9]|nr:MAG: hypothetical protein A2511_07825 [Deltaproteobacteria bacterium RIFOXYD12_FULL_50_9]
MPEQVRILCVDDENNVLKALKRLFMDEEYEIITANSGLEGLAILEKEPQIQVVISDYRMPEMNGVEFLRQVFERRPETVRIVLSGFADTASVVGAINEGHIYKFIPKPWNDDELKITIAKAVDVYFLWKNNERLTREVKDANEELLLLNERLSKLVTKRTEEIIFQDKVIDHTRQFLDTLPIGVLGIDTDGTIVQCNRRALELLEDNNKGLLGFSAQAARPPEFFKIIAADSFNPGSFSRMAWNGREFIGKVATLPEGNNGFIGLVFVFDLMA